MAHRADGSGTTANFTKYLTKAAPTTWTLGTDKTVAWPTGQQAGNGNAGVAQIVKDTDGAIGYVDFSDAKAAGLTFAAIKNASGKFVAPSIDGATAALAGCDGRTPDLTYDPLNATGADGYPITSPTYILVYATQTRRRRGGTRCKGFIELHATATARTWPRTVDFAPLPPTILSQGHGAGRQDHRLA